MNYHVLGQATDLKTIQTVMHIPVPSANNDAGINYRTALVGKLEMESEDGVIHSVLPDIDPTELTAMQAGSLYEFQKRVNWSVLGLTALQKRNELDAAWTSANTEMQAQLQVELQWWGYERNVP